MSLINKMLQDLDARGGAGARTGGEAIRPVAVSGARSPAMLAVRTGVALTALALAAWYGWTQMHRAPAPALPKVVGSADTGKAGAPGAGVGAGPAGGMTAAPAATVAAVAAADKVASGAGAQAASAGTPAAVGTAQAERPARAERADAHGKREAELQQAQPGDLGAQLAEARRKARDARAEAKALAAQAGAAKKAGNDARKQGGSDAAQAGAAAKAPRLAGKAAPQREAEPSGVTVTSQQQGENAYKRALVLLQEGRVHDAMAGLEQAVFAYPRHDGARQALVGLLLEAHRHEEAMRHLQLGLGLDPKQQQMAMLLARLQIERGGPAVETLMRTLPYAGNNPDYLAFLAGALQKAQRHREAVEQYQAALRLMPQNGVWWMGMGISLQADKRTAEAVDAYQRAKASGSLSPELVSFVERKLAQMGR